MKYRYLGDTGIQVSMLGMGTMTFGREADAHASAAIFNRCREAGINLFDCADAYNNGVSEEILGKLTTGCRDELILTSKVYGQSGPGINDRGLSRRHIMAAAEASLRRLKTDRIDIYFLHHQDLNTPLEESLRALDDLVAQGKIVYSGVSNFPAWRTVKTLGISDQSGWHRIKCIQPMYNLVKRQAEVELLPMARSEKLGVLCYNPLGGGLLSGKYADTRRHTPARFDSNTMYASQYGEAWMRESADRFCGFARERGIHPVGLAVAWAAHHPAVTAPIIGARNAGQLEDSLNSISVGMTPELYDEISALSPQPAPPDDRSEAPEFRK